jgi:hypothetical protein
MSLKRARDEDADGASPKRRCNGVPARRDRVIGQSYVVEGEVRHWSKQGWKCLHQRQRSQCKECGGASICEHERQRSQCKECGGASICKHQRPRSMCKECGGASICKHERQRSHCKECGGASICKHQRQRSMCKECGGASICKHERERSKCKECGGTSICDHGNQRAQCRHCGGSRICTSCKHTGTSVYHPLCAACFYHENPQLETTRNYLTKQRHLHQYVIKEIVEPLTIYDRVIDGGCSKKRPDFLWDCGTHSVILENDEDRHVGTQCEERRIMELFKDLGSRPLKVLRFNPDDYRDEHNDLVRSCFKLDDKRLLVIKPDEWTRRWEQLKPAIEKALQEMPTKEVTVQYLFYNHVAPELMLSLG